MGRRPKNYVPPEVTLFLTCLKCGKEKEEGEFYVNKWSRIYKMNKSRVPFCKECVQELFNEYAGRYDEKTALVILCAELDMYYNIDIYKAVVAQNNCFNFGWYLRTLQNAQYQHKSFANSVVDGEMGKINPQKEDGDTKWSKEDKRNKKYVVSVVGYDPFEGYNMQDEDRKYCYNLLSGYCDIDGIKEDNHKMIGCIQIVQNQLQIRKIDEIINPELKDPNFDDSKLKSMTDSKKKLQDNITKLAQDNNISSKHNGKRGKNAFTQKMKDMSEEGYEPARPNLYDIKMSEALKQVAQISARCIADQLDFDDSEYSAMVKEQREMLTALREKNETLEEENRNLKNELSDLKLSSKKRGG